MKYNQLKQALDTAMTTQTGNIKEVKHCNSGVSCTSDYPQSLALIGKNVICYLFLFLSLLPLYFPILYSSSYVKYSLVYIGRSS